jgi:hypothetical protein
MSPPAALQEHCRSLLSQPRGTPAKAIASRLPSLLDEPTRSGRLLRQGTILAALTGLHEADYVLGRSNPRIRENCGTRSKDLSNDLRGRQLRLRASAAAR